MLLLHLVEEQSHQVLIHSPAPRARTGDFLTPLRGLEGSSGPLGSQARHTNIFKTVEDPGASGGEGCFMDNLMITTSLWGRCHYHHHLHHHINCHCPKLAYNELRVREGVADHTHRTEKHLFLILMTGVLSSEVLRLCIHQNPRAVGGGKVGLGRVVKDHWASSQSF